MTAAIHTLTNGIENFQFEINGDAAILTTICLLYTSDAADE